MKTLLKKFSFENVTGIYSLDRLMYVLDEDLVEIKNIAESSKSFYKPKRELKGTKVRKIDRPFGRLKDVQQKIDNTILKKVPVPEHMYGSVTGKTIQDNAKLHLKQKVVVSIDLRDCFPNTDNNLVYAVFRERLRYSKSVSNLLTKLTTVDMYVPQGAPTSSTLVNIILTPLYNTLESYANDHGLRLSFWVDDIILSGDKAHDHINNAILIIQQFGYRVRGKKIKIMMRGKSSQEVTGVSVNGRLSVPKKKLEKYTDEVYEYFKTKIISLEMEASIQGKIGYVKYVDKKKAQRLQKIFDHMSKQSAHIMG